MSDTLQKIIDKLRDDVREDVKEIHGKIEHQYERIEKKMDSQRICIVDKIEEGKQQRIDCFEKCSGNMNNKIDGKWFRWIVGFLILGVITIGGFSATNKTELKELNVVVQEHIKKSSENLQEIKDMIKEK